MYLPLYISRTTIDFFKINEGKWVNPEEWKPLDKGTTKRLRSYAIAALECSKTIF
jgi:hypothetical protein